MLKLTKNTLKPLKSTASATLLATFSRTHFSMAKLLIRITTGLAQNLNNPNVIWLEIYLVTLTQMLFKKKFSATMRCLIHSTRCICKLIISKRKTLTKRQLCIKCSTKSFSHHLLGGTPILSTRWLCDSPRTQQDLQSRR